MEAVGEIGLRTDSTQNSYNKTIFFLILQFNQSSIDMRKCFLMLRCALSVAAFAKDHTSTANTSVKPAMGSNHEEMTEKTDSLRNIKPYQYFFHYLPTIAKELDCHNMADFFLKDPWRVNTKVLRDSGMRSPFTDDQIKVDYMGEGIYIWRFPEPKEVTECLYVAFIPAEGHYDYYTLEKSIFVDWMIGSQDESGHSNYGEAPTPKDPADFLRLIKERALEKEPAASFSASPE